MKNPTTNYQPPTPNKHIALVADWITKQGGGEKVVEQFHSTFPEAPIYTSYCAKPWRSKLDHKVITGYLQHWPFSSLRRFLPVLRQHWFAHLDLSNYDIIISITGNGEAKFVRPDYVSLRKRLLRLLRLSPFPNSHLPKARAKHISYCHTPVHFYWAQYDEYVKNPSMSPKWLARLGLKLLVKPLRKRDYRASQRVDKFIANSTSIQAEIQKYYDKDSTVIHPPINTDNFVHLKPRGEISISEQPNCVWWGRVVPAKRLDIAIEACNQLGWPLTIIGDGPDLPRLKELAGTTITFTGYLSDTERASYIKKAELFLFPSKEDFGVAPVEALSAGLPLVAYKAGGALDYVKPGINGIFFDSQTTDSLTNVLRQTRGLVFSGDAVSKTANEYSSETFCRKIREFVLSRDTGVTK